MKIFKKIYHFIIDFPVFIKLFIHVYKNAGKEFETLDYNNQKEIDINVYDFKEYQFENIIYPEIKGNKRYFEFDIEFFIDKNGNAQDIKLPKEKFYKRRNNKFLKKKIKKTNSKVFFKESKKLISNYNNWIPFRKNTVYVKGYIKKRLDFFYHKEYFEHNSNFCLNPEHRPYYVNKENDLYQQIIMNKYGCDGVMNILCIVEKNGKLSNFEAIDSGGKIAYEQVIQYLDKLNDWKPAFNNGEPVRTQLHLNVYI